MTTLSPQSQAAMADVSARAAYLAHIAGEVSAAYADLSTRCGPQSELSLSQNGAWEGGLDNALEGALTALDAAQHRLSALD